MATINRIEDVRYSPAAHEDEYEFKPVFIMRVHYAHKKSQLREFVYDSNLDDGTSFLAAFWPEYAQRKGLRSWIEEWYENGAECNVCFCTKEYGKYVEPPYHNHKCTFIMCHECVKKIANGDIGHGVQCPQCSVGLVGIGHRVRQLIDERQAEAMPVEEMQVIELMDYEDDEAREVVEFAGPL